ncbi:MAG: hypothetical protein WAK57_15165, partial [Desulfobacterales bacterium]
MEIGFPTPSGCDLGPAIQRIAADRTVTLETAPRKCLHTAFAATPAGEAAGGLIACRRPAAANEVRP